jgi:hypothetical protein
MTFKVKIWNGFYLFFLSDRINKTNWVFFRFPDETANVASASRRKTWNIAVGKKIAPRSGLNPNNPVYFKN